MPKRPLIRDNIETTKAKASQFTTSDALTKYYSAVSSVVVLTAATERGLLAEYKSTEDLIVKRRIQAQVIEGALKFVIHEARKQPRAIKDREALQDLIAAGNIGLVRALEKFDITQGVRFLTYAGWWVRHEMREENKHLNICHIPTHAMSKGVKAPTPIELDETVLKVEPLVDTITTLHNKQSIGKLLDLTILSVRESFIIRTCFGIQTRPKTLRQVGKILVITGERVRQLREGALGKMRNTAAAQQLSI